MKISIEVVCFCPAEIALYYGYPNESETAIQLLGYVKFSFGFYVLQYITRLLYDFQLREFLRRTWFEAAVMVVLLRGK